IRNSNLEGFKIQGSIDRLITTLFADDTTVYLSKNDDFNDLQKILTRWCKASGAKFNIQKTEIIPVGSKEYRTEVLDERRSNPDHQKINENIRIAKEGQPVRILGTFAGNGVEQASVWTPTLEKIGSALKRWGRSRPTQDGKRLILGMEIGGRTQYLTHVQGMPKDVEGKLIKMIRDFMWDDSSSPMISLDMFSHKHGKGGKKLLHIPSRNSAIQLRKLQKYLTFDRTRPRWARVADELYQKSVNRTTNEEQDNGFCNPFLQTWDPITRGERTRIPTNLKEMYSTGKKYGVTFTPTAPSRTLRRALPIWYH
ncbi:hypothetical protein BDN72DRAFT_742531, partial [Pluteus cervinus]